MPRLSIRFKLSAMISILVLSFIAFNVGYYPLRVERQIRTQSEMSAIQVAETASYALTPAINAGNQEDIAKVLEGVKNLPAFSFSVVFDDKGRSIDSTPSTPPWVMEYAFSQGEAKAVMRKQDGILVAMSPVFFREPAAHKCGNLVIGFTTDKIQEAVSNNIWLGVIVGMCALALGIASAFYLANRYIKPILQLTRGAHQVAQGNLESVQVEVRTRDELEDLSRSFEVMTNRLRVSRDEIERQNRLLEFRVQERTRQLMETVCELEEIRSNLEHLVQERTKGLEQSRAELRAWAETLEEKVKDKTLELTELNESLMASFQKLQQVDRLKDEFMANMSHELRTPLNAVIGFSGLLLQENEERIPADVKEDLEIILQNGQGLMAMIDNILDLSKMEAGTFELDLCEMDPLSILEDLKTIALAQVQGRQVRFSYEPPPWTVRVEGDPPRLKQVLSNLVFNALKFTEKGEVTVTVERNANSLLVLVRDTGIGMSQEDMNRLFQPFQQVDGSITRRFGGTGLGLALSQRLMALMKGRIAVDSIKGKGSTFILEMPILPEEIP